MDDLRDLEDCLNDHFGRNEETPMVVDIQRDEGEGEDWGGDDEEDNPLQQREARMRSMLQTPDIDGGAACGPAGDACYASSGSDDEQPQPCQCPGKCIALFDNGDIQAHRLSMREIDKDEKEMLIMGVLQPFTNSKTWRGDRKRQRMRYTFKGTKVCRSAFLYLYDIGQRTLKAIIQHVNKNGRVPRVHGNKNRRPHNALTYEQVRNCVDFLVRYGDEHGLPQPAAPRGRGDEAPVYLPACMTKCGIHDQYVTTSPQAGLTPLGLSSFKTTWNQCIPSLKIAGPRDDVCHTCELLKRSTQDAVTEEDKLECSTKLTQHIEHAKSEREYYRRVLEEASIETPHDRQEGPIPPCSTDLRNIHYTFDYSQQVSLPHHYRQMGPLYFMTPRKVQIFGIRDDGIPRQYNYIIDEDQTIGSDGSASHGPNSVISMLDHSLTFYGHGEKECSLHCDNCPGQNKNRYTLAYLSWRTTVGLHDNISLHMQIPGHTRCLVDSGFANIKRLYRRSDVDCLQEMIDVVNKSSRTNRAVPYLRPDGEPTWEWREWKDFLTETYKPFPGINKYYHFQFVKDEPGIVYAKVKDTDCVVRKSILKKGVVIDPYRRPRVLTAAGLSKERQNYLYKTVRPLVRAVWQDVTCPRPL